MQLRDSASLSALRLGGGSGAREHCAARSTSSNGWDGQSGGAHAVPAGVISLTGCRRRIMGIWQHRPASSGGAGERANMVSVKQRRRHGAECSAFIAMQTDVIASTPSRRPRCRAGTLRQLRRYDRAADKYFRQCDRRRPTMDETIAFYREKKIGFVNFTVDAETQMGRRRIPNDEIARPRWPTARHHDRLRQHRPAQGQDRRARGREARSRSTASGFQVPPDGAGLRACDKMAWPIYEASTSTRCPPCSTAAIRASARACAAAAVCACRTPTDAAGGRGDRLPGHADRRRPPTGPLAGRGDPLALHKPNIWIDLSGWSPTYFRRSSCSTRTRC